MTALGGKLVGAQYLPSYLSLSSWYSPSQCYLQLQPPSLPLQVRLSGVPFWSRTGPSEQHACASRESARAPAGLILMLKQEPHPSGKGSIPWNEFLSFIYDGHLGQGQGLL